MVAFLVITGFLLFNIGLDVLLVARDKRYIQRYLQSKGGHGIHVDYQWLEGHRLQRVYAVIYLSPTDQPLSGYCDSWGYGLRGPSIRWRKGTASLYTLVPDKKG